MFSLRPAARAHKVKQRLVLGRNPLRRRHGRHRLHAPALNRKQQAAAIILQRTDPRRVTDHAGNVVEISLKSLRAAVALPPIHASLPAIESAPSQSLSRPRWWQSDSVRLAQATQFGRQTLSFAAVLFTVSLFIGIATFVRCVAINLEDMRWVVGMSLIRRAYLQIAPELEQFFLASHEPGVDLRTLGYGSPQRFGNLINSLTTTSSVVAALNSVLAGALACDAGALAGLALTLSLAIGAGVSLVAAALHIRYAARFRRQHEPKTKSPA